MKYRAKFKKGEQRRFLKDIKKIEITWKNVSDISNIKKETLRSYYYEKRTIPYNVVIKLACRLNLKIPEIKLLKNNWGSLKAGALNYKNISINTNSQHFAELLGIILGDGHINKNMKVVSIHLNRLNEEPYAEHIQKILKNIDIKTSIYRNKNKLDIMIYSKKVSEILISKGLPKGNKTKSESTVIPEYIFKNKQLLICCLRGLFDTDGSISLSRKTLQIYFSNYNQKLLESFSKGLKILGFTPCLSKKGVMLYANQAIRFYEIIGTSNLKNAIKYIYAQKFKKLPKILSFKKYHSLNLPYVGSWRNGI